MSTPEQEVAASRYRRSVGLATTDTTTLPTAEITDLLAQASEKFDDDDSAEAYARVIYFEGLFASSSKMATYKKNQTTENVSDIFGHVALVLKYWTDKMIDAINSIDSAEGSVRTASTKQIPTRWKEYPNS